MFRRVDCLSLDRQSCYLSDPCYAQCESLYRESIQLQNEGDAKESTAKYLQALELQAGMASVRRQCEGANGALSDCIWIEAFLCLTVCEAVACASLSRRAKRLALDSSAWLRRCG